LNDDNDNDDDDDDDDDDDYNNSSSSSRDAIVANPCSGGRPIQLASSQVTTAYTDQGLFVVFFRLPRHMPRQYLQISPSRLIPNPYLRSIHDHFASYKCVPCRAVNDLGIGLYCVIRSIIEVLQITKLAGRRLD
jgi:hypothetical protein